MFRDLRGQLRRVSGALLVAAILAGVACGGIVLLSESSGRPISHLTRDPAAVTQSPAYIGVLSNIGILLWAAATSICALAYLLTRMNGDKAGARFFLASSLLGALLTFDDLFLLHELVGPQLTGLPERAFTGGYALLAGAYLLACFRFITSTDWILLAVVGMCLGLSMALDWFVPLSETQNFIEDSLKFGGILLWLAYFARTARQRCAITSAS